jgi:hypothetical protein
MADTLTLAPQDTFRAEIAGIISANVAREVWGAPVLHGDETTRHADGIDRAADAVVDYLRAHS